MDILPEVQAIRDAAKADTRITMQVQTVKVDEEKAYLLDFTNRSGQVYCHYFFPDRQELQNVLSERCVYIGGDTLDAAYQWAQRNVPIM